MTKKKVKTENYTGIFTIKEQKLPYRCPICGGNGIVPDGFFMLINNYDW